MITYPFTTKVVGVSFVRNYPYNLLRLQQRINEAEDWETFPVVLRHNPNNEHDSNAVEVHIVDSVCSGIVGHLPRNVAAKLVPSLVNNDSWFCHVVQVDIDSEHRDQPGLTIRCEPGGNA